MGLCATHVIDMLIVLNTGNKQLEQHLTLKLFFFFRFRFQLYYVGLVRRNRAAFLKQLCSYRHVAFFVFCFMLFPLFVKIIGWRGGPLINF